MKTLYTGFLLAHMLSRSEDNFVGIKDLKQAAQRVAREVPGVHVVVNRHYLSDLIERYSAMFERADTQAERLRGPGFRRAFNSREYFTDYYIRLTFGKGSAQGLEGDFSQEEITQILSNIHRN